MANPRHISATALLGLVGDGDRLRRGVRLVEKHAVRTLVRSGAALHGEVLCDAPTPYRVRVTLSTDGALAEATCTCLAAGVRAPCEHAAALLVAWVRDPSRYAVSSRPLFGHEMADFGRAVGGEASSEEPLTPREAFVRHACGDLPREEMLHHTVRFVELAEDAALREHVLPAWTDGALAWPIARALGARGEAAVAAAVAALQLDAGRTVKITALRVLQAVGDEEAEALLLRFALTDPAEVDPTVRATALAGLAALSRPRGLHPDVRFLNAAIKEALQRHIAVLREDPSPCRRARAAGRLASIGSSGAWPALRAALLDDDAVEVQARAALALALLGDTQSVDPFVRLLAGRSQREPLAEEAASALGVLADGRGLPELTRALSDGWRPDAVQPALLEAGAAALPAIVALVAREPVWADHPLSRHIAQLAPETHLVETLAAVARGSHDRAHRGERVDALRRLAGVHPGGVQAFAQALGEGGDAGVLR